MSSSSAVSSRSQTKGDREKHTVLESFEEVADGTVYSIDNFEDDNGEPKLEKSFSLFSVIGVVYSSFATPISLGTYLSLVNGVGGSPFFFYTFLFTAFFSLLTAYSVAEIASVYPHSSAQIYWTQQIAPKKHVRYLSYMSGFIASACYLFGNCATCYFASNLVMGIGSLYHPDYVAKTWHVYLVFVASNLVTLVTNMYGARLLPRFSSAMNYVINIGSFIIFVSLLAKTHPKQSAAYVFKDIVNSTGWKSNGVVFFLSLTPGASSLALFDGACHMTDEIPNPERNIPLVIFYSYTGAALVGVISIIVYMFCIANVDNLSNPIGGEPIFQLFKDSFNNQGLTTFCCLIVYLVFAGASVTVLTSSSRLIMAFSRLKSIPGHKWIGKINPKAKSPFGALIFSTVVSMLIGLLMFGSSAALNAVMGSYVATMYASYIIPFTFLILKKDRFGPNSNHFFNLGKFGKPINIICVIWFIFAIFWMCMPVYRPVTPNNMTYTSAALGAVFFVGLINWFAYARKHYDSSIEAKLH